MNRVVFCMLVLVLLVAGCGGEPSPDVSSSSEGGSMSPTSAPASSGGGETKTLDPCALLTDAQVAEAIGAPVAETTSGEVRAGVSCDYMADSSLPGRTPHLFILAYTDAGLVEFEDVGTGNAQAFWDNFYNDLVAGKTSEASATSYTSDVSGIEVMVEEVPGLGDKALFYTIEGTTQQLWMHNDYAVFSLTLTLGADQEGQEKERMKAVAQQIVDAMP